MTGKELYAEYKSDFNELMEKTQRFCMTPYMNRVMDKNRGKEEFTVNKPMSSKRGNGYLAIICATNYGSKKNPNWDFSTYYIGKINTFKGISYLIFYDDIKQTLLLTPHFFRRYKERLMEVAEWQTRNQLRQAKSMDDIAAIYMRRNLKTVWIETNSVYSDKTHLFSPIYDGIALLQWSEGRKILQANTFITLDMLDEKQTDMAMYGLNYIMLPESERRKINVPMHYITDESNADKNKSRYDKR